MAEDRAALQFHQGQTCLMFVVKRIVKTMKQNKISEIYCRHSKLLNMSADTDMVTTTRPCSRVLLPGSKCTWRYKWMRAKIYERAHTDILLERGALGVSLATTSAWCGLNSLIISCLTWQIEQELLRKVLAMFKIIRVWDHRSWEELIEFLALVFTFYHAPFPMMLVWKWHLPDRNMV